MIEYVSACGWSCTAASAATRGRVTCKEALRSIASSSWVAGMAGSLAHILEAIQIRRGVLMLSTGEPRARRYVVKVPPDARATDKLDREVYLVAGVVIVGVIMSVLDMTIVNVALETLSRELHSGLD